METELNAVFRDFEVDDADGAVAKKRSVYPMSNESKFNFWSFVVLFARGELDHGHFILLKRFLRVWATFERSHVKIRLPTEKWIFVVQCLFGMKWNTASISSS